MQSENYISNVEGDEVSSKMAISAYWRISPIIKHLKAHVKLITKGFFKSLNDCFVSFQNYI